MDSIKESASIIFSLGVRNWTLLSQTLSFCFSYPAVKTLKLFKRFGDVYRKSMLTVCLHFTLAQTIPFASKLPTSVSARVTLSRREDLEKSLHQCCCLYELGLVVIGVNCSVWLFRWFILFRWINIRLWVFCWQWIQWGKHNWFCH